MLPTIALNTKIDGGPGVCLGAAFAIAARAPAHVLEQGRIVAEGTPAVLARDARIREAYLGQQ